MALAIADRVKETTTTTGTGTLDLDGAVTGFQTFVAGISTTNTCHYCITDGTDWEVGIGTVTDAAPDTLSRDTVIASSNADALVSWGAGAKDVFCVLPGDQARARQALGVGLTSISNTAITAVTNIDVIGFASGTYDNYEIWIANGQPSTDSTILEMESSTDGGTSFDTGVSDYTWAGADSLEGATGSQRGDTDDSELQITHTSGVGNAANENVSAKISVFGPEAAEFTAFYWTVLMRNINTALTTMTGGGTRQSAADVDALRFHWSSGDWAAQGNIQFLGIAQ